MLKDIQMYYPIYAIALPSADYESAVKDEYETYYITHLCKKIPAWYMLDGAMLNEKLESNRFEENVVYICFYIPYWENKHPAQETNYISRKEIDSMLKYFGNKDILIESVIK